MSPTKPERGGAAVSRKLLAFLVSDVKAVRILCKKCKCGVEANTVALGRIDPNVCAFCKERFFGEPFESNPFSQLSRLIEFFQKRTMDCDVELVIADSSDDAKKEATGRMEATQP